MNEPNIIRWEHCAAISFYRTLRCKANGLFYKIIREWAPRSDEDALAWYDVERDEGGCTFRAHFTPDEVDCVEDCYG